MTKSSQLPDGGWVPTLGSNYMMDGFDFDSEYGDGVDAAEKTTSQPRSQRELGVDMPRSTRGLSGLPDGFAGVENPPSANFDVGMLSTTADEESMDLGDLMEEEGVSKEAGWAARSQLPNLNWLESATQDPARLPESVNLFEKYRNELNQTVVEDDPESGTRQELAQAWGVNRRTDGQNLVPNVEYPRPVLPPVSELPGDQFRDIVAHAMRRSAFGADLSSILGDVKAAIDPYLAKGHTLDHPVLQRTASAVRMIRAEHGLSGNVFVRDSAFPSITSGKWDSAIRKRCASARYFLTTPGSKLSSYENYLGKKVVTSIPWDEAASHYRSVLSAAGRKLASGDPRKALKVAFLNQEEQTRAATLFPTYVAPVASEKEAREGLAAAQNARVIVKTKTAAEGLRKKADARIDRWVRAGLLTTKKALEMKARISDPFELYRTAAEAVTANISQTKGYTGPVYEPAQSMKQASKISAAEQAELSQPMEVRRLLRWASVAMTEGEAGRDLDARLKARFAADLLKKASEPLVQLRKKHEGLSGHLYVEASAYASPEGTSGCDKGALVHRANAIKAVLGMSRCGSCASNVDDTCQKYNKTIIASVPEKQAARYQEEMIRLANTDDRTASLYAASFDEQEYRLQNDNLDDITYDNVPPPEDLGEVLFEGFVLDDEE